MGDDEEKTDSETATMVTDSRATTEAKTRIRLEHDSVVVIQAIWKSYLSEKKESETRIRLECDSAVVIQTIWKSFKNEKNAKAESLIRSQRVVYVTGLLTFSHL